MHGTQKRGEYSGPASIISPAGERFEVRAVLVAEQSYEDVHTTGGRAPERVYDAESWRGSITAKMSWIALCGQPLTLSIPGRGEGRVFIARAGLGESVSVEGAGPRPF